VIQLSARRIRTTFLAFAAGSGLFAAPVAGCFSSTAAPSHSSDGGATTLPETGPAPDVSMGSCPVGWYEGSGGVCFVSLSGKWTSSTDANTDGPDTVAEIGAVNATAVSVVQSHTGMDNADCGCNAQHLNIALGKTFQCASSTLEFEYATTAVMGPLDTPAVDIRFCTGPCPEVDGGGSPQFYTGPQYVGSPFAPVSSNCAYEWENDAGTASLNFFPASAQIKTGQKNTVALGSYAAPASGDACTGSFDTIDVHLQVYNCSAAQTGTSTLSYLRIY
jgi:hypothetical protein